MLEQVLDYIHNYFVKDVYSGNFKITDGKIDGIVLLEGQYFKIVGSVLNDGVYQYPVYTLNDEQFNGEVWAMAVPPSVIALVNDIEEWTNKYGDVVNGPFQSESFGGYSYTKSGGSGGSSNYNLGWEYVFGNRLNQWRKIS